MRLVPFLLLLAFAISVTAKAGAKKSDEEADESTEVNYSYYQEEPPNGPIEVPYNDYSGDMDRGKVYYDSNGTHTIITDTDGNVLNVLENRQGVQQAVNGAQETVNTKWERPSKKLVSKNPNRSQKVQKKGLNKKKKLVGKKAKKNP